MDGCKDNSPPKISKRLARKLAKKKEKRAKRELYKRQRGAAASSSSSNASVNVDIRTIHVSSADLDTRKLSEDFFRDGYVQVRGALLPEAAASFCAQISRELKDPALPQQNRAAPDILSPETWPFGGQRRVAECLPSGRGAHWSAIAAPNTPVAAALDTLMGAGDWELPLNPQAGESFDVRHWYSPVVFPEHHPEEFDEDAATAALRRDAKMWRDDGNDEGTWTADEDARAVSAFKEHGPKWGAISSRTRGKSKAQVRRRLASLLLPSAARKIDCVEAASSWRAVNRRRVPDKGWHVDIGPGFDTDWNREISGHRFQGCIILVLLSDCERGHGGTAFIPGSHRWVRAHLASSGPTPHQDLNAWCISNVARKFASGKLRYSYQDSGDSDVHVITQMSGKAGDVWLVHPWLIHSGTCNLGPHPRVMANGMVRVRKAAFEQRGCALLSKEAELLVRRPWARYDSSDEMVLRDKSLPRVSVIVPIHNGLRRVGDDRHWLDCCFESVCKQTYRGEIEVSAFDDASDDGTDRALVHWKETFGSLGIKCVMSGSRWKDASAKPLGIGGAKNRAVDQSTGSYLCFLDVDDEMLPKRIELQLEACVRNPTAIIGCGFVRSPKGATPHYSNWANSMTPSQLWLHQFRENTVLMPTWFITRALFDAVGGFQERAPESGEAEDMIFFHEHLSKRGALGDPSLVRVGDADAPLLVYRWTATSGSSRVSNKRLIQVRARYFEQRILNGSWRGKAFYVWGAGRDGKTFVKSLSPSARERIVALIDIDPQKCGTVYEDGRNGVKSIPIVHFDSAAGTGIPTVVTVSLRRSLERDFSGTSSLEANVASLGLVEGETLWYFN